ncbi:MAG: hypothetical protein WC376_01060 [Candidatus Nanoarchaeia archaeon]|jgi:acetyltransferase-like isoleucine patch superfamily enzyme
MIDKETLGSILLKLYGKINLNVEKEKSRLIVKPEVSADSYMIPDLSGVLTFEFYGLNNPMQYLAKKGNWLSRNYLNWNPLPPVKARIYANKGVKINNLEKVVISPNSCIDCPSDFVNQVLNPLRQVSIGNGTFAGERTRIITTQYNSNNNCLTVGPVHVGSNCLTAGATILHPGTLLKDRVTIGALEDVQGIFENGSVISHANYGNNKLPNSLGKYHYKLFKIIESSTQRLKKGTYKNKELVISRSFGSYNISILPKENAKNIAAEYSQENLCKIIMNESILSGTFLSMDSNWKKAFEPNNPLSMLNTRICMGLAKLILMPSLVRNALYAFGGIHIGKNTKIGRLTGMGYLNSELIHIGNNVSIGSNVIIADHYYTPEGLRKGIVYIDDNCVIGDNSFIAPSTYLSKGVKVKNREIVQGVHI